MTTACSCSTTETDSLSHSARPAKPIRLPAFLHFGVGLADRRRRAARSGRRLAADGIPIVEEWDEPDYVSVKCRDPDGYVVEAAWEPDRVP